MTSLRRVHILSVRCLRNILDVKVPLTSLLDQTIQLRLAGLGVPGLGSPVTEEFLHFFNSLAAGFGVSGS